MTPILVIDHNIREFWQNRFLDADYMAGFHGGPAAVALVAEATRRGYALLTADVFLAAPPTSAPALVWSEMRSPLTRELFRRGAIPAVCSSGESPIVAYEYYHRLAHHAGHYAHAFLFTGAAARLRGTRTRVHPYHWPNHLRAVLPGPAWQDRRFLTLINSNKRAFPHQRFAWSTRALRVAVRLAWIRATDPWMRAEVYGDRLRAIVHFARHADFDLYGQGWGTAMPAMPGLAPAVAACYRGALPPGPEGKYARLQQYRFAICFENTVFPGYITEKIFDCFFTGVIPIYYGAPDIAEVIPPETFLDLRAVASLDELEDRLRGFTATDARRYHEAAAAFLASPAFAPFTAGAHARALLDAVDAVRDGVG